MEAALVNQGSKVQLNPAYCGHLYELWTPFVVWLVHAACYIAYYTAAWVPAAATAVQDASTYSWLRHLSAAPSDDEVQAWSVFMGMTESGTSDE